MENKELKHHKPVQMSQSARMETTPDSYECFMENTGEPPVCAAPGETQFAIIGMPFSVDIVASDPDGRITGIEAENLPLWASLNIITELPAADALACITGTPGHKDEGLHVLSIVATDNDGNQATSPLEIQVTDYGFTDEQPGVL